MRQQTRELALASVLGALAVLFLFLGGVLPLALYACPLLASVCLLPVREECRASYQWCCFFAAAILGLLLGPDKESALLFCFLGYFNGCGRTMFVMFQGIVGAFCVRIPVVWLISHLEGATLFQIGLATPTSSVVQIILCIIAYRVYQKKRSVL